jgi:amino acid adenylation domain-containing protein
MDKGIDALLSFFGIIYSSSYYVLINPEFPLERVNQIKNVLVPKYVITNNKYIENAKEYFDNCTIYNINDLKKEKINEYKLNIAKRSHNDIDPLYINFTSGSTGVPKGVVISHKSVIDFIDNFTSIFKFNDRDIIANQAPFDFDVSVKDIYSSICVGATLVIIPKMYFSNPSKLLDYICLNNVTTLTWAVSALCLITTFHGLDYKVPEKVNKILFSGEVMPLKHVKQWVEHLPDAIFVNLYGPTEITCNCTYHVLDKSLNYEKQIPIGKPFDNEEVFLLDDNNNLITVEEKVGEICVKGTALSLGYYNNQEQTNKYFMQNPLNDKYIDMIYKTGDLGYIGKDGEFYFSGRKDFQIKHMGHRIELEEIEKAMSQIDGVDRCFCTFEKDKLKGYYVGSIEKTELYSIMKQTLPIFMIPGFLRKMDSMPLTKNGKIDRQEAVLIAEGRK